MPGRVYLVGAGPGRADLVTVRGRELLSRAGVVVHDDLPEALLALAPAGAERVPVGSADGPHSSQETISALLIDRARAGHRVVRLKCGDPFVFGRGGEECAALAAAGIGFEVVPGVSAGLAAAALTGIPVTERDVAQGVLLTIVGPDGAVPRAASDGAVTAIVYMASRDLGKVASELVAHGRKPSDLVALVSRASLAGQRVVEGTLGDIAERSSESGAGPPAVLVVGEAVRRRRPWADDRPLAGRAVVVTRARAQAGPMAAMLEEAGAEVVEAPCIATVPPEDLGPLDRSLRALSAYDWLVLTSANGAEALLSRLDALGLDARALSGLKIAAVGPATAAALGVAHLKPDALPEEFNAEALARSLGATGVSGRRFLVVRALEGRELLPETLRSLGAHVEVVPAYRTVRPELDVLPLARRLEAGTIFAVAFASPSAVRNFSSHFAPGEAKRLLAKARVAAIGPATAQAVLELGLEVSIRPSESTAEGLVAALAQCARGQGAGFREGGAGPTSPPGPLAASGEGERG